MEKTYTTRFYGNDDSIAIPMISAFGDYKTYRPNEDLSEYQALIVECNYDPCIIDVNLCRTLFEACKTIVFLGITERELNVLAECIGRKYNISGKNIVVCPVNENNENKSKFAITFIPNYTDDELIAEYQGKDKNLYHQLLNKFQIHPLKSSKKYNPPPEGLPRILFPVGNYDNVSGSWSIPLSTTMQYPLTGYPGLGGGSSNIELTMEVELKVLANVFLSPKKYGGDGNYHVIFHVELSSITPTSWYAVYLGTIHGTYTYYYVFSYAASISPQISNDRKYSLERTAPDKESSLTDSTYGYQFYTKFGLGTNFPVIIPIEVIMAGGPTQSLNFNPQFASMINQEIFPNLINYVAPEMKDTQTVSKVQFNGNSDNGGNHKIPGKFEMISYFKFERKENETSFPVKFLLNLDFLGTEAYNPPPTLLHSMPNSFELDLAKMTINLPKYHTPPNTNVDL